MSKKSEIAALIVPLFLLCKVGYYYLSIYLNNIGIVAKECTNLNIFYHSTIYILILWLTCIAVAKMESICAKSAFISLFGFIACLLILELSLIGTNYKYYSEINMSEKVTDYAIYSIMFFVLAYIYFVNSCTILNHLSKWIKKLSAFLP
jgi:hypothetical protein